MATETAPALATAKVLMKELIEASHDLENLYHELEGADLSSEKGFELIGDLWALAELVKSKAVESKDELDAVMDARPD